MADIYKFKGVDLRTATVYDVAAVLDDHPAFLVSPDHELSDEQERILSLYSYAEEYNLTDLIKQLEEIYKDELTSIL
ncbi:hypothetical protein EG344_00650 [Chryseobacterium sp. G0162]|uniref:hypothetical protein n=1 Tax=Chryseobacterium sp. G0162 TaxID=2487063 RepID=UPI000F50093B|nr:hypothetical protein [Chryseobacterium sp. G0162]AZB07451.1 hypothetical protein EG344_00650 [Chryseobacterium sp. G0162]